MEIKELNSDTLHDGIKEAMQSEKKMGVKHFTAERTEDNAYGWTWNQVVREYLNNGYKGEGKETEIVAVGVKYKVLNRGEVTAFYDADGNTLFDVENKRLEKEYEWLIKNGTGTVLEHEESEKDNGDAEAGVIPLKERTAEEEKESGIDSAIAKLQKELKEAKQKEFAEPIIGYLIERCRESESLAADICQAHKSWEKCYGYIVVNARKKLNNVSGPVCSDVVFEWAEDYYHKDDKAEEEKKAKKEAEDKTKKKKVVVERENIKAAGTGKNDKAFAQKKAAASKEMSKPKRKEKDMDGQLDMFSMMGI